MLPDGLDEALQESAATGGSAAAAAIAAVSSGMDVLSKGTECWYERNGERKLATVLSVDYGDDPPFYVIRMDGAERQTVRKYLIQLTMRERVLAALGAEAEAYQVLGTALLLVGLPTNRSKSSCEAGAPPVERRPELAPQVERRPELPVSSTPNRAARTMPVPTQEVLL
jgi:hypothetical protein